jgi:hypothetical protein
MRKQAIEKPETGNWKLETICNLISYLIIESITSQTLQYIQNSTEQNRTSTAAVLLNRIATAI